MQAAAGNLKKVSLELGGKSPNVVYADADLEAAIPGAANGIFFNHGQCCNAGSRLYVQNDVFDDVVSGVAEIGTNFGLAAGVFTRDISKAHRTAHRLRAGTVWINTYHVFDAAMPFGGYKESGWGREMGHQVLENYLETKSVVAALWGPRRWPASARQRTHHSAGRRRPRRTCRCGTPGLRAAGTARRSSGRCANGSS